jgi:hypothetical protein
MKERVRVRGQKSTNHKRRNMKLTEFLKRITPLPWLLVTATDSDKWIGTGEGDDRITTLDGNTQPLDHAYLVHAANVLPQLVETAKTVHTMVPYGPHLKPELSRALASLRAAIAKAEAINTRATA